MIFHLSANCSSMRSSFSAYLDGAVPGLRMQEIGAHLTTCASCRAEYEELRAMQLELVSLGPAKPPEDMCLRLRLAISHEAAQRRAGSFDRLIVQWENAIRPMMVQVTAGLAGTIVLVGGIMLLLGMVASPEPVMANDEPLGALTQPHYMYSATRPGAIVSSRDSTIVVEALISPEGRVYDYNIVSGTEDDSVKAQVRDQLLLSVFEPAHVFGMPVRGRVVLTFSGVSVRG